MTGRDFKDRIYEHFAVVGRAMASPKRLEILDLLAQGERSVEDIAGQTGLGIKNASVHLRALRSARLLDSRREPPYVFYRLADESVFRLVRDLQAVARARLAELDQVARAYVESRDELEPIGPEELVRRLRDGDVTLLDVRPVEEFRAAHIPGARSVPLAELEGVLATLSRAHEVIAYCRGPYCAFSLDAVEALRRRGFRARRMEAGLPDWRALGHPVEGEISL
jgi:DNA-binding transcriptional ArsR family regulator